MGFSPNIGKHWQNTLLLPTLFDEVTWKHSSIHYANTLHRPNGVVSYNISWLCFRVLQSSRLGSQAIALSSPLVSSTALHVVYLLSLSTGHPTLDYGIASAWFPYLFAASDYILLTDVQRELRMVKPPQRADEPIENAPLSRRVAWGVKLFSSSRGVGWAHEPRYANPPHPSPSTPRAVAAVVILETVNIFNMRNPALYAGGPSLAAHGWFWRYQAVWIILRRHRRFGPRGLAAVHGVYHPRLERAQLLEPRLAPDYAPVPLRARKFFAHRVLHLKPGSKASAYTQLYAAFLISGIMHYLPDYMALRHWAAARCFSSSCRPSPSHSKTVYKRGRRLGIKASWRGRPSGIVGVVVVCVLPPHLAGSFAARGVFEELRYSMMSS
ncbi:hypothetical protein B0H19DRAFT_1277808 [Mycena capillaripes]|nr:hypothetical protein B0H19DRAFT_1277808 [Mycena capillaripes]